MANVVYALRKKLLEGSLITSQVGQRIYPNALDQKTALPAIVLNRISTSREHTIEDVTLLAHSRIEVKCYANKRLSADSLADAIRRSGICSFRGTVDGITFCGTQIDSGDETDDEPPTDGNHVHRYITRFDLMVHYKEAN